MAIEANLAAHPFRNERLSWFGALAVAAALGATSFVHLNVLAGLVDGQEAASTANVRADEARIAEIARSLRETPPQRVDAAVAARHRAYKQIVDRRAFSWTGLLLALDEALPDDVRLVRIAPVFDDAELSVDLTAEAKSREAAFEFAESLERSAAFGRARIRRLTDIEGGVAFDVGVSLVAAAPAPSTRDTP
jgi:hypothetical protein